MLFRIACASVRMSVIICGALACALPASARDPDVGTQAPNPIEVADGQVAGADCEVIGAFTTQFQFPSRYRGNLYRIDNPGVVLGEIKMQFAFAGTADLYVSVHRKQVGGTYVAVDISPGSPGTYILIAGAQGLGATVPAFYSTGPLNAGAGVALTSGDYAIGFAWGPETLRFGRDSGVSYPRPFDYGLILASVSRDVAAPEPPLPDMLPFLVEFTGAVYSQQLCILPVAVPTVSQWGLVVLTLMGLIAGAVMFRRRNLQHR